MEPGREGVGREGGLSAGRAAAVAGKLAIGVAAFATGPRAAGRLPLEAACTRGPFLNALLLWALMFAGVYRLLRWFVFPRQD